MNKRAYALDALRGYAIISMVLSGAIVFGILPGWMYHGTDRWDGAGCSGQQLFLLLLSFY